MTSEQADCILSTVCMAVKGRLAHRFFPRLLNVFYLGAQRFKAVFGKRYVFHRETWFETYSENYSAREGVSKAYTLREGVLDAIPALIERVKQSTPFKARPNDHIQVEAVNMDRLRIKADEGSYACAVLLRKAVPTSAGRGVIYQTYRRAGNAETGRRFAIGVSLQQLPSDVRRYVLGGLNYVDVDVVNCLPTILDQAVPINMLWLSELVSSRESVLAKLSRGFGVPRKTAKTLLLSIMGGASVGGRTWRATLGEGAPLSCTGISEQNRETAVNWCKGFASDMNRASIWCAQQLGEESDSRERWRWLAKYIQAAEDSVLTACLDYHSQRGEEVGTLVFDGYLVRGCEDVDRIDSTGLQAHVRQATGYDVRFSQVALDGNVF